MIDGPSTPATVAGDPAPPKRRRGRPPSVDRDAALAAVVDVFWQKGFDGASLDDLTRAAGVSRPTLYALFGDKEATLLAAIDAYGSGIGARPIEAFDEALDAGDGIAAAVQAFLAASVENGTTPDRPPGCLIGCVAAPIGANLPSVNERVRAAFDATHAHLARRFTDEVEAGHLAPEPSPDARAAVMIDLMNAQALRARGEATRAELMAELPNRVAAVMVGNKTTA